MEPDSWSWDVYKSRSRRLRKTTYKDSQVLQYSKKRAIRWVEHNLNCRRILKFILCRFTIIEMIATYQIRDLTDDVLSGISTSFVHIAQGLAYGILSGLTGANGLYTSFFAPLIYAFFGTSKHASLGTFAVLTLLTKQAIDASITDMISSSKLPNCTNTNSSCMDNLALREDVAMMLCLATGIVLLVMTVFRFGALVVFFTKALVGGYMCAAAFFVFTSQVPSAMGFKVQRTPGFGVFFKNWYYILISLGKTNAATLCISLICIAILAIGRWINGRYIDKIKISLPLELFCIAIACVIGHVTNVYQKYNITSIGTLPIGLASPRVPTTGFSSVIQQAIALAFVTMAVNFALILQYAELNNYLVSTDQDLFAYSIIDIVSGFFLCIPACGSLSRTAIAAANFQRTQLSGIVSSVVLLIVLYTVTRYLSVIPLSVLSGIVIYNIHGSLLRITDVKLYWAIDFMEGATWIISFICTLLLDLDIGLVLSLVFSLVINTCLLIMPRITQLGQFKSDGGNTVIYVNTKLYPEAGHVISDVAIIKLSGPLLSYNANRFKEYTLRIMGLEKVHQSPGITKIVDSIFSFCNGQRKVQAKVCNPNIPFDIEDHCLDYAKMPSAKAPIVLKPKSSLMYCILDFGQVNYIDSVGIKTLCSIKASIAESCIGGQLIFVQVNEAVMASVDAKKSFDAFFADNTLFHSIAEALAYLKSFHVEAY